MDSYFFQIPQELYPYYDDFQYSFDTDSVSQENFLRYSGEF